MFVFVSECLKYHYCLIYPMCARVCVYVSVHARAYVCVCVCLSVCLSVCESDNKFADVLDDLSD